jgi:hypothetical protein
MSSFTDPLVLEFLGPRRFKLYRPFTYRTDSGVFITVPAGFITDFASIPRIFWAILPPAGRYGKAAVIHDYLYQIGLGTCKEADDLMLEAMQVLEVAAWKRVVIYRMLRVFGIFVWRRYRRA